MERFTVILTILFIGLGSVMCAQAGASGKGTQSSPWIVSSWGDLSEKMRVGGFIKLDDNITAKPEDVPLEVPGGKEVTLDLNGWRLDFINIVIAPSGGTSEAWAAKMGLVFVEEP